MKTLFTLAAAWLGLLSWPLVCNAQPARPAIELFFDQPVLSASQLSPDGRLLALRIGSKGGRVRLAVLDLQVMKPTIVADFRDADVDQFAWVNDRRLVFDLRQQMNGPGTAALGRGLFAIDADGSGYRQLVESTRSFVKVPDSGTPPLRWDTYLLKALGTPDNDDVFVVVPEERSREKTDHIQLQRLNSRSGRVTEVDAPLHSTGWTLDAQGVLRLAVTRQRDRVAVHWRDPQGQWRQLDERDQFAVSWMPRYVAPDGTLFVEAGHQGTTAVFHFDPARGKLAETPLAAARGFDLHPRFIASDTQLLGLRYQIDAEVTQWLDPAMKALQATVDTRLPATANRLSVPARGDSPWVLVEAFADVQPRLTYLYTTTTRQLSRVGGSHPAIDPAQMGITDFVRDQAADGLEIPAYLTLPPGDAKKNLPLVVLVHGGPWVRGATWAWHPEVQFLASRGDAVLQPEFRGSTGFGRAHFEAGWKQWGQAMQTDLADGARWAIAQGIADPKRVCIAGASYGGYATLMGLARDAALFRCGVAWVGVTDLPMMFSVNWSDTTTEVKQYGMSRLLGDPVADAAMLRAQSPLTQAARIRQPLLMAYGAWDVRVPLIHGEAFRDAVKPHNPQLEWVVYPEEGHGWEKPETRIDFWGRVERLLGRHLAAE